VDIRAVHVRGYDRLVFEFSGSVPARRSVRYVDGLVADPRGNRVAVAGRAVLRVVLAHASAHSELGRGSAPGREAFDLPNVLTVVRAGDFEGVVTYGIGLAKRAGFHVSTMTSPSRVVIDVAARFPVVSRRVYFFNPARFAANTQPFVTGVARWVPSRAPAAGLLDRLFAGPSQQERAAGLRLRASHATGFKRLSISSGIARIELSGGCRSDGSTATIAEEITATLKALPGVSWVKIYDPAGRTERPSGAVDSVPTCLEP
jgi:hypothetical protein